MIRKVLLSILTLSLGTSGVALADDGHTFPVDGKTYVIHRFNNANSYIYEDGMSLNAAPKTNTNKQYWQFIPTATANRYYIQNVTSKRYIQSTNVTSESQIKTGTKPVEFEIKANTTQDAAPKGYYYICSTDQTISVSGDNTLGLNYQESTGKVVAYYIRYNRGNSYWDIQESTYDYEAPAPVERSALSKRLGIYYLPCGSQTNAYLTQLTLNGVETDVPNPINFTATAKPSSYFYMVRSDSAQVTPGTTFNLAYEAANLGNDATVTAYFDWDKDGIFEIRQAFDNSAKASTIVEVPDTAALGKVRMRLRITDNGTDGADEEVSGQVYDFTLYVAKKSEPTAIENAVAPTSKVKTGTHRSYGIDGRRVKLETHHGVYIQKGKKLIK